MSTLMHLDSQIGGTNVVNSLDSDATTAALSAKQGKELNTNKADRTEIASASGVFDINHIGGYKVGDIVIHDNVINVCQVAQAQGSVHIPTNTAGDTYWKISSILDVIKSSVAIPISNGGIYISGKVVTVNVFTAVTGQGTSQGVLLGTIPEGYRPNNMVLQSAFNSKDIWLQINSTGEIYVVGTGQFRGVTTYVAYS